jgi:UDP-N-acetylglucosamine/UDP-N-acetylgalactosamine diphosphorylase
MTDLLAHLTAANQPHLVEALGRLSGEQRARLAREISSVDLALVRAALAASDEIDVAAAEPHPWIDLAARAERDADAIAAGFAALKAGKAAALLMAGGSGTRLGWPGPKGTFPVYADGTTLYEFHARKVRRMAELAGTSVPLAVMLSDETSAPTRAFFADHAYFGLAPSDVLFFEQGTLPAVDEGGRLLLAAPDRLTAFPDGHGGIYKALLKSGTLAALEARGVLHVFVFQVDNPLVPVLDPAFLGYHLQEGSEFSFVGLRKVEAREKVAVFAVQPDGSPVIVEYIALPPRFVEEWTRFAAGNPAIYLFSLGFMRRMAEEGGLVPHRSRKKVPFWDPARGAVLPEEPNAYKLEALLFDAMSRARKTLVMEDRREASFAPIKNPDGVDSAVSARALLRARAVELLGPTGGTLELPPERLLDATRWPC